MNQNIRKAKNSDIPEILNLLHQVCNVHNKIRSDLFKKDSSKYSEQELLKIINEDSDAFVLVFDNGGKAGAYLFAFFKETKGDNVLFDKKEMYVDDLCVSEDLRGSGIGKMLLEEAKEIAREKKCDFLTLNVWSGNDNAERFYEKFGFKPRKTTMEFSL